MVCQIIVFCRIMVLSDHGSVGSCSVGRWFAPPILWFECCLPLAPVKFGRKLRQPLRISLNRRDSAKFVPLLIQVLGHPLSSNPRGGEQVSTIRGRPT
jgi:hypothetical protein